ncbi:ATP-dependent helicase [Archaeoglobus sp.]
MIVKGKAYDDEDILKRLNWIVAEWFRRKFKSFTPPQRYSIVPALEGKNVLITSPTGSGKTLAGFLPVISDLVSLAEEGKLEDRVYAVYVSPLRALNNDIRRNLEEPLREIYELAKEKGVNLQEIRIAVRTGDTTPEEKAKQLKKPPHILITTPETLSIVLSTPKFSRHLTGVKYLIVDEIHALAENKRGTHLTLSMERLENIQEGKMVRIGLSATIHPLDEVARFLVGCADDRERDCIIADVTFEKRMDIKVVSPIEDFFSVSAEEISEKLYGAIAEMVKKCRTALIFTNTRSATERVVYHLKKLLPKYPIKAHHSSLSREVRLEVEEDLKKGKLKAVVSSTSLELGIDIGYIDLVILIGSPKSINRALQRIGRAGHRLEDVSVGRIVVVDQDDLVECTVLVREALSRRLDRIHIPKKPLDVLCQHVIGMALERKWNVDEAFRLVKRAYPYKDLTMDEFLDVLKYLSGKFSELEEEKVYGKIWFDGKEFGKRSRIRPIYYMNVGTIPDEVAISVITKDGRFIGKVEEEFAERLVEGDVFVLAGKTFRYLYSKGMSVVVEEVEGVKPTIPSWFSEQLPLSYDLALRIQKFRGFLEKNIENPEFVIEYLQKEFNLDYRSAKAIYNYFYEQKSFSLIPTNERLLIEIFREDRYYYHVFHTLVGRRANDAISRVFAYRIGKNSRCNVGISLTDNGFMLKLPFKLSEDEIKALFNLENFREDLIASLDKTELLRRRFRHVAVRSFMILRRYMGWEKSVYRQQISADNLLKLLKKKYPNFPVLRETYREIVEDYMDIENALDYLERVVDGRVKVEIVELPMVSPFALNVYLVGKEDVVLMADRREVLKMLHEMIVKRISKGLK